MVGIEEWWSGVADWVGWLDAGPVALRLVWVGWFYWHTDVGRVEPVRVRSWAWDWTVQLVEKSTGLGWFWRPMDMWPADVGPAALDRVRGWTGQLF